MRIIHRTIGALAPEVDLATRYLKGQLTLQGVSVPISDGCLEEFAHNANGAVVRTRRADEPYLSCLHRHLDSRARFILLWITTDEPFDCDVWGELVSIARRFALPRPLEGVPGAPCAQNRTSPTDHGAAKTRATGSGGPKAYPCPS